MLNQDNRKSCHNCIKRRIVCDKTGNSCNKCARRKLTCPGYGVRYRFAKGAASSNRPAASPLETEHLGSNHQINGYRWIEYEREPMEMSTKAPRSRPFTHPLRCSATSVPNGLSDLDPRTHSYFMHFAAHVSPFMVLFDDESNGYRHQILPLARSEPIVERAVCIASAFHLSSRHPKLRAPAEIIRDNLIRELSAKSAAKPDLSETTWAILILLIVADLVTGHEDVSTLHNLLAAFLDARGHFKEPATQLERFLYFQSSIIKFFSHPFSSGRPHSIGPQPILSSPVSMFKQYASDQQDSQRSDGLSYQKGKFASYFPTYEQIFDHATEIYSMRMESAESTVHPDRYMKDRIQNLRMLCEQLDLAAPGAHVIVWPIFVAAAESKSDDDRQYFTDVLRRLYEKVGYANIHRGIEVLPELWAQRKKTSWVSALAEYKGLVIC